MIENTDLEQERKQEQDYKKKDDLNAKSNQIFSA